MFTEILLENQKKMISPPFEMIV